MRRNKSHGLLRYVFAVCGWLLIIYEWVHVSRQASPGAGRTLILLLIVSLLVLHLIAMAWIAHNKGLAARGKRGLATRYTSPAFSEDHLGRPLVIEPGSLVNMELDISVHGSSKSYTSRTATAEKLDTSIPGDSESFASTTALGG